MLTPEEALGMPLDMVLQRMGEQAAGIAIRTTRPPKGARKNGQWRIVRVRDGEWTVCAFDGSLSTQTKEE